MPTMNRWTTVVAVLLVLVCALALCEAAKPSCGRECHDCTARCVRRLRRVENDEAMKPLCEMMCYENGPVRMADRERTVTRLADHWRDRGARGDYRERGRLEGTVQAVRVAARYAGQDLLEGKITTKTGGRVSFDAYSVRAMGQGVYSLKAGDKVVYSVNHAGKAVEVVPHAVPFSTYSLPVIASFQASRAASELAVIRTCSRMFDTQVSLWHQRGSGDNDIRGLLRRKEPAHCCPRASDCSTATTSPHEHFRWWADEQWNRVAAAAAAKTENKALSDWGVKYTAVAKLLHHYDYDGAIRGGPVLSAQAAINAERSKTSSRAKALQAKLAAALADRDVIAWAVVELREAHKAVAAAAAPSASTTAAIEAAYTRAIAFAKE